jgi:hypothetical protein
MFDRFAHLAPMLRVGLVALSALGLAGLVIVLATGVMRGEATRPSENAPVKPDTVGIPPMDRDVPVRMETATFAMG